MTRVLIAGGDVLDGTGAPAARADVAIEDGRILEVGPGLDGDVQISATGLTLVPGLIDCHVHAILSHLDLNHLINTPLSYRFFEAARNLRRLIGVGITTVRDAAGADLGVKRAVDDGLIVGPRMQISVGMICQTGGHNDGWTLSGKTAGELFPIYPGVPDPVADGPEEMRRVVRRMLRSGADVIKIATSGGVMSPRDDPSQAHFRDEEIAVAVSEARAAGASVMSHAQALGGIKAAVRCGVRSIEHGFDLDDEAIAMMLEAGTFLVPTLTATRSIVEASEAGVEIDSAMVQRAREATEQQRDSFARAAAAGVRVAMGSDSGISPHGQNLRELESMVAGGLTATQALQAATSTAAELLGLEHEIGTIEPGKRADLVFVEGDPLQDMGSFAARVRAVVKDGELLGDAVDRAFVEGSPSDSKTPASPGLAPSRSAGT